MKIPTILAQGVHYWPGYLDISDQRALLEEVFRRAEQAPFYRAGMPCTGRQLSVEMTNFGPLGWYTDAVRGYRYETQHPITGKEWPDMPAAVLRIWTKTTCYPALPE